MEFRIADTFTSSLTRLTGEEQKAVKMAAFDLQLNPVSHGLQAHRIDKSRDKNFWSVRANRDVRIIVHRTEASFLLCYAGHHDAAYQWAERRRLETHPKTGAAQLVEVRETVEEITIPRYVEVEQPVPPKPPLFAHISESALLSYGVPEEWLDDVRRADEDSLLELADHLPAEAAEALLNLAVGVTPQVPQPVATGADPFEHPDAQRRFRTLHNVDELEQALDYPWERWMIFLHPSQRDIVDRSYGGPARVAGSAGTGKTIVAIHRAAALARSNPHARLLLTTFSDDLADTLRKKLRRLLSTEPRVLERIEVSALDSVGERLYAAHFRKRDVTSSGDIRAIIESAAPAVAGNTFSVPFLFSEWEQVVDAWGLETWEDYRDITRLGRKARLREPQRAIGWQVFERVYAELTARQIMTRSQMFTRLAQRLPLLGTLPIDHVVVDEAQDLSVAQLRFVAALGGRRPDALFFAGDLGQRIFQAPFSWKSLGVDVRGRSRTLRINYRTSHQIRQQADRLLGAELSDLDGIVEDRRGTVSAFNGPEPTIQAFDTPEEEADAVGDWLRARLAEGIAPEEIAVLVRSDDELSRAEAAASAAGATEGAIVAIPMHRAKGLEFRAVAVMACDDEVIPLRARMESATDQAELEYIYETERHLLYVACTRARDHLLVTCGDIPSEFLGDLRL